MEKEKQVVKHKAYTIEQQPRSLLSRYNLLKVYKKHKDSKFNEQEFQELGLVLNNKIEQELDNFSYDQPVLLKTEEFLLITDKKKYLTQEQQERFKQLCHIKNLQKNNNMQQNAILTNPIISNNIICLAVFITILYTYYRILF